MSAAAAQLCSHGQDPRTCTCRAHNVFRHCPLHEVAWDARGLGGCWAVGPGEECEATPRLGWLPKHTSNGTGW